MTYPANNTATNGNDVLIGLTGVSNTIDGLEGDDLIFGGKLADILTGSKGNDTLVGDDGNDLLSAQEGDDCLYGGNGSDTLNGGTGKDFLQGGFGDDVLNGLAGNDSLVGDEGNDFLDGGQGDDTLSGDNGNDTVVGADGNDLIFGGDHADALYGGNDQDTLVGDNGKDFLQGGFGNDALYGGNDDDTLDGDEGNDFLQGGLGNDVLFGSNGNDTLAGDEGNDFLQGGNGEDTLFGDNGDDTLVGDNGNDLIEGGNGNDALYGGNDNDTINGGEGNDVIHGGQGNDSIKGGNGNDTLTGGSGADIFAFSSGVKFNPALGVDNITDFNVAEGDQIHLSKTTFTALQSFNGINFSNPGDFAVVTSNTAAEASGAVVVYNSTTGELFYNTNGNNPGFGDGGKFAVLDGAPALSASNFMICDAGENPNPGGTKPTLVSIGNSSVVEGQKEVFDVTLSAAATGATKVKLDVFNDNAQLGVDYKDDFEVSFDGGNTWKATGGDVTVNPGATGFKVRLSTIDDKTIEPIETFRLNATANGGAAFGTGTIVDNDVLKSKIVGSESLKEGDKGNYTIQLDQASDKDRFFTVQINNGSAKRYDGNGAGQDVSSGGAFDIKGVKVFVDRVPNDNINGYNNRAAVGPGDASWDYTVYDAQGKLNTGNTIVVKVAAGQTVSDQFMVQSWKENVTVDLDYAGPKYTGTAVEGTENLSLKIVDGAGTTVTNDTVNVSIADGSHYTYVSPIALDLNGDGVKTLSIDQGVQFDLLNTGNKVVTGWLSGQDGFLAVDANGNGQIDDRSELFGGGVGEGFAALATFDSNGDGVVNASDSLFGSLSIWQDANEDGLTDNGELKSLSAYGISGLNTAYSNSFSTDAQGNILGETSSAITAKGQSIDMIDVYFKVQ
jgi:Ca2+-binding RTX toxin-like protein